MLMKMLSAIKRYPSWSRRERGFALVYTAVMMTGLAIFSGLAVDSGRAYMVKIQLTKAVDGAALGAARDLNTGDPQGVAGRLFTGNFPAGYMGVTSVTSTTDPSFFSWTTDEVQAINIVTVTASATVPTTFMRLAGITQVQVTSSGQATRRMVDLSLVIDVSSSIGSRWPDVRDAARMFINSFDQVHDRLALLTFSNGAIVLDQMPSTRGFNKPQVISDVPQNLPGGSTLMVEGIYRGWDELRSVPNGTQSTLRVLVLFTDGASNGVPGIYPTYSPAIPYSLRTFDFPHNVIDPDGQTWNNPQINGVFDPQSGAQQISGPGPFGVPEPVPTGAQTWDQAPPMTNLAQAPCMPLNTQHIHYRSVGIPTQFPLVVPTLTVNGVPQMTARPMHNPGAAGYPTTCPQGVTSVYPADLFNINNAARNVLEIIGDQARRDVGGDYPIHIYTIGMSYLIRDMLGTIPEMPEDILKRVANDPTSLDYNGSQLAGKYFYAPQAADVAPAFQGIQNEILRLSR